MQVEQNKRSFFSEIRHMQGNFTDKIFVRLEKVAQFFNRQFSDKNCTTRFSTHSARFCLLIAVLKTSSRFSIKIA
jgi:hypothetical protein